MQIRVYYEDTDCGGVVYYANYLRWFERSRTEFLRDRGVDPAALHAEGVLFTVSRCDTQYRQPARYDDLVAVETEVVAIGGATLDLRQTVRGADGTLLVESSLRLACVSSSSGRPARIPAAVRTALA